MAILFFNWDCESEMKIGDRKQTDRQSSPLSNHFMADLNPGLFVIQDPLHILTKLRNAIATGSAHLSIGGYVISTAFLINLVTNRPRGEHHLLLSDY